MTRSKMVLAILATVSATPFALAQNPQPRPHQKPQEAGVVHRMPVIRPQSNHRTPVIRPQSHHRTPVIRPPGSPPPK